MHLPYVEQVTLPVVNQISVEDQVAVAAVEVAVPLRVHSCKLQILNSPHLETSKGGLSPNYMCGCKPDTFVLLCTRKLLFK